MNVLLLPTTDSVLTSWQLAYSQNNHCLFWHIDSPLVTQKIMRSNFSRSHYAKELNKYKSKKNFIVIFSDVIKKIKLYRQIYGFFLSFLIKNNIHLIIVSNDNAGIQNFAVNAGKSLNIPTVLHQAAAIGDPYKKISWLKKKFLNIKRIFLHSNCTSQLGFHVDSCWLMGDYWEKMVKHPKSHIVGNAHYRYIKQLKKRKKKDSNRTFLVYYSQPYLKMFKKEEVNKVYEDIEKLLNDLSRIDSVDVTFKSHPQEHEHKYMFQSPKFNILEDKAPSE